MSYHKRASSSQPWLECSCAAGFTFVEDLPLALPGKPTPKVRLRRRLLTLSLAGIVPIALIAGLGLVAIIHEQKSIAEQRSLEATRLTATAVDVEINRSLDLLQTLSQSPFLDDGNLDSYQELVRRVVPLVPGWKTVIIATPDGQVLRRIAAHHVSADGPLAEPESFMQVVSTLKPVIGQLEAGPSGTSAIPLRMPVMRNGKLVYVLTAVLKPEVIFNVINLRRLPSDWVATVVDANGRRIARTRDHEKTLGKPAAPSLMAMVKQNTNEGSGLTQTVEGIRVYSAYVHLKQSGWFVATGIPAHDIAKGALKAFAIYGGGLLLSLIVALLATRYASRRINDPMRALRHAALAMGQDQAPHLPETEIREIDDVAQALIASATARQESEHQRDLLVSRLQKAQTALSQQVEDLEGLYALSQSLLQLSSLHDQLSAILNLVCELLNAPGGFIGLEGTAPAPDRLVSKGISNAALPVSCLHDQVQGNLVEHSSRLRAEGFRTHHDVTIRRDGQDTLGWLTVLFRETHELSPREIRLVEICAATAALFIDRASQQEKARRSEQQLHVALNSSAIPFAILSPATEAQTSVEDFTLVYINDAGATALRSRAATLTDKPVSGVLSGWAQGDIYHALRETMISGEPRSLESLVQTSTCEGWFHIVATPFQNNIAVWFADISERKLQEQQLREADRQKDEFLATLAHELRNPLAPIRQAVSLLETGQISEEQRRWSQDVIKRQVTHMGMLLDDLLDVSRITRGKIELRKQPTQLASVLRAAVETTKPLFETKGHTLTVELPSDSVALNVDPLRLEQILINLLSNAAKYTPQKGQITVTTALNGNEAHITVSDNGIGIEPDALASLFEMFVQVPRSSEETNSGLGIGLALAQSLAQLHDGTLTVASEGSGKGACFTLSLPYDETLEAPHDVVSAPAISTAAHRRIVVADDNPDIAETMAELLRLEDHEVSLAYNGFQALELFKTLKPDVMLLDVGMPGMTGHQVAQAIRALPEGRHTLLIAITGWGQDQDKEKALQAGFDYHFTKPVSIADIYALLQ